MNWFWWKLSNKCDVVRVGTGYILLAFRSQDFSTRCCICYCDSCSKPKIKQVLGGRSNSFRRSPVSGGKCVIPYGRWRSVAFRCISPIKSYTHLLALLPRDRPRTWLHSAEQSACTAQSLWSWKQLKHATWWQWWWCCLRSWRSHPAVRVSRTEMRRHVLRQCTIITTHRRQQQIRRESIPCLQYKCKTAHFSLKRFFIVSTIMQGCKIGRKELILGSKNLKKLKSKFSILSFLFVVKF